jgi:ABC-type transport system involved in cytochrome bd biosynthesis fused ATPase/permease subunit
LLATVLLMLASFFTISSILASADLPPLEAWLLPLAFGPVFVLATKTSVSAWLSSAPSDRLPSPTQRVTTLIIAPCLGLAALSLVSGVAVKSVAVGALVPLPEHVSQLSSALMFAGLALGELAGAAALAARQHRPGARAYSAARDQYRWAVMIHEFGHARLRAAESSAAAAAQALAAHSECKAARAQLALVAGWSRAAQHSRNGDSLVSRVEIRGISVPRP